MRRILEIKCILLTTILLVSSVLASDRTSLSPITTINQNDTLFSPTMSQKFYEIAHDMADSDNTTYYENEIAISFLTGALSLDENNSDARSLLLKCVCRFPERRSLTMDSQGQTQFNLVYSNLGRYIDENTDIEITSNAVSFLLNQTKSHVQKQTLLEQMIRSYSNKNQAFNSRLLTMLGLLQIENNSFENAEKYFRQAYQTNRYNKFAFSRLYELSAQKINQVEYLERLRLDVRENPIDIRTVLLYCQSLEQFQLYDAAAKAYEYCADLFAYQHPNETLPLDICIPWSINCYNSSKYQYKCLEIAENVRKTGKFDIRLESLAGRAAGKMGEAGVALQIIRDTEKNALGLVINQSQDITYAQMAWFYSFVLPMTDNAMEWSNRAFASNQESPIEASLLAYTLVQKKEFETAKSMLNQLPSTQIAELALAKIQLEEGSRTQALENLKKAISRDPGSFEAEQAREILAASGEKYLPPVNPDTLLANIKKIFADDLVTNFVSPEKMFSVTLSIRNKEMSFGGNLDSAISIINNSSEPIVISDDSMFKGNIRIDAIVTGDLSKKITNLINKRIGYDSVIGSGKSKIVSVKLITGELKKMLSTHPQASLNITFMMYLDPVNTDGGKVKNTLASVEPVSVTITRPGVSINGQKIQNLVDSISTNQVGQKIQSAKLFIGLLKEQEALSGRTSSYHVVFSSGMKTMLESALIYDSGLLRNSGKSDLIVKVFTMAELLSLPLDYELVQAVSDNLYDQNWPVRLMAIYVLAESQGDKFVRVLESISENDQNQLVRDIASAEILKIHSGSSNNIDF